MAFVGGQLIGPYEVVGTLGAGGMGVVYRARDKRLGRDVAIKVLPDGFASDAGRLGRFELEARAVAALNHPNILAVYDVGTHEGVPYLVMELLEGQSLRDRLTAGAIPTRKALEYAVQVANGLAAAHDKGLIHRDLKPENLFLTKDERVKILDFGLAKSIGEVGASADGGTLAQSQSGAVLGTAGYMSPEQVRGMPADERSDIFAFGVVLYELLTGSRAFGGATPIDRGYAILNSDPQPLLQLATTVSPAVDRVVSRCLEKLPEQRFQSARDVSFAIEAVSGVTSMVNAVALQPARRRSTSRAVLAIGVAGLVVCAAAGWVAGTRARPQPVAAVATPLRFTRLTFSPDHASSARFAPDGTVVFGRWSGQNRPRVFTATPGKPDVRALTDEPGTDVLSVSSTGELAIITNVDRGTRTGTVSTMSLAGGAPRPAAKAQGAEFAPDGGALAIVRTEGDRSRIEYPPRRVIYEAPAALWSIRFDPSGRRLAFLSSQAGIDAEASIELITLDGAADGGTHQVISAPWPNISTLAWAPSGNEIWVTGRAPGEHGRALWAVGLDGSRRLVLDTPGWFMIQDIARDGRVLLKLFDVGFRLRVQLGDAGSEADLSWFDQSWVADVSPDGKSVLFSETGVAFEEVPHVFVRSIDGAPAVHYGQGTPWSLSRDGQWALVSPTNPTRSLQLLPLAPGDPRDLPGDFTGVYGAHFLGRDQVIFWGHLDGGAGDQVFIQPLDGGPARAVAEKMVGPPSPDGRLVPVWTAGGVFLWNVETGAKLAWRPQGKAIGWSHDGGAVLVRREGAKTLSLWEYSVADGGMTKLHDFAMTEVMAVAAAEGTLAYTHQIVRNDLYIVDGLK